MSLVWSVDKNLMKGRGSNIFMLLISVTELPLTSLCWKASWIYSEALRSGRLKASSI